MAHIVNIFSLNDHLKNKTFYVEVALKPAGTVKLTVPVPPKFFDALFSMAQTVADAHEAQMRAEILGDTTDATGGNSND